MITTNDDVIKKMADRLLCWKLPQDFSPDGGISFTPNSEWPTGTNLLNAEQAEALVVHMFGIKKPQ